MSQTRRNTAFSPRREATLPARSVAKAKFTACPSCGRTAGCNCRASEMDALQAWEEDDRYTRMEFVEKRTLERYSFCITCGRAAGCNHRSDEDVTDVSLCPHCGRVSDRTSDPPCCKQAAEERRENQDFYGMTDGPDDEVTLP